MMFACVEDDRKRHDFKYDLVNLEHGERESKQQSLFMHICVDGSLCWLRRWWWWWWRGTYVQRHSWGVQIPLPKDFSHCQTNSHMHKHTDLIKYIEWHESIQTHTLHTHNYVNANVLTHTRTATYWKQLNLSIYECRDSLGSGIQQHQNKKQ